MAILALVASTGAADSRIQGTKIEEVLREITKRQKSIHSLSADFRQEKMMALLAEPEVSTGTFAYAEPNRVRWTYETPKPVTMVISDGWLTTWYPDLHRAEKLEVRKFEDRIFRYLGAASGAIEEMGRYFDFRFVDDRREPTWLLELEPKTRTVARRVRSIRIWIDRERYITSRFEYIEGDGDVTRYEFSNIRENEPMDDRLFRLDLPPGVRVEQIRLGR